MCTEIVLPRGLDGPQEMCVPLLLYLLSRFLGIKQELLTIDFNAFPVSSHYKSLSLKATPQKFWPHWLLPWNPGIKEKLWGPGHHCWNQSGHSLCTHPHKSQVPPYSLPQLPVLNTKKVDKMQRDNDLQIYVWWASSVCWINASSLTKLQLWQLTTCHTLTHINSFK